MSPPDKHETEKVVPVSDGSTGVRGWLEKPSTIALLLAAVTLVVFGPVLANGFINYDDPQYVIENGMVMKGLTWSGVRWAFVTGHASNWHPLTWLSHMLDVTLFGLRPWGHHLTSLLLHTANTVLLFLLFWKMTGHSRAEEPENELEPEVAGGQGCLSHLSSAADAPAGALWRSAFVAALFALHPLHVESVAWVAERKDVLSTFFGLLSLIFYARYAQERVRGPWSVVPYLASLFCFALGLMSKPMLVTLPFVLLLLDYWPLGRVRSAECGVRSVATRNSEPSRIHSALRIPHSALLWEKLPFFLLSAASCVVTFWVQKSGGAVRLLSTFPATARLENAVVSHARYLGKTFWPADLAVFYPHPGQWPLGLVLLAVGLLAGVTLVVVWFARRLPFMVTGWFWFVGTLVPVIGLVQVGHQAMADRYTYLPLVGLFVALVWATCFLWEQWRLAKVVRVLVPLLVLVACAGATVNQLRYWRDSERVFRHALAVTRDNALANHNLASCLAEQGKHREAVGLYREALRIDPNFLEVYNNLGVALFVLGDVDEAVRCFQRLLAAAPDNASAHDNLAVALATQGHFDQAMFHFRAALGFRPGYAKTHFNLGNALALQRRFDEAVQEYSEALRLQPDLFQAHLNLGSALADLGRRDEAIAHLREALRLRPDLEPARQRLRELELQ